MSYRTLADVEQGLLAVDAETPPERPNSYCATCDMGVTAPWQADYHRQFDHDVWMAD